jgi:hypothetical protein
MLSVSNSCNKSLFQVACGEFYGSFYTAVNGLAAGHAAAGTAVASLILTLGPG